jgi:hypothetical protein
VGVKVSCSQTVPHMGGDCNWFLRKNSSICFHSWETTDFGVDILIILI